MNFLAHIYLSGDDDEGLMIGNYIGDSVKGRRLSDYPFSIQCGILLHREIDSFTDSHPVYRQSKDRFVPVAGRYAGVVCESLSGNKIYRKTLHFSRQTKPIF